MAQSPAPPEEDIVVTGRRDGGRVLSVDFQRVARQCAECRRVLAQIEKMAEPYQVRKRQVVRDRDTMVESINVHSGGTAAGAREVPPEDSSSPAARVRTDQAGRLMDRVPDHFRKDQTELRTMRRDVSGLVAAFLKQLEPHVAAVAEDERRERGASVVVRMKRRASANRPQEVTDSIIRRLDARRFSIVLPGA